MADKQKLAFNSIFNAEVGQIISTLFHLTYQLNHLQLAYS